MRPLNPKGSEYLTRWAYRCLTLSRGQYMRSLTIAHGRHAMTGMNDLQDTLVALASPPGAGLRAIVRISGPRTTDIVRALLPGFAGVTSPCHNGVLRLDGVRSPLPAQVWFWAGPRSYTGQDLAELHLISSPPLVHAVLAQAHAAGARAAGPGEFTLRAFLAGKIDLTKAEAILGVTQARTDEELQSALKQLAGGLAHPLQALREDLLNLLADVEAGLDFTTEDLAFISLDEMLRRLTLGLAQITLVQKQLDSRTMEHRLPRVVLAGPVNAGKSSLFNVLTAGKALVSTEAGTTRDYLEAPLRLGEMTATLIDTAGRRDDAHADERRAQTLGAERAAEADLVLWCDPTAAEPAPGGALKLATCSDAFPRRAGWLAVSAHTGAGLPELRSAIASRLHERPGDPWSASLSRCRHHVLACRDHLRAAHHLALEDQPAELLALELRLALEQVGAIVGTIYTDDLLGRIFSRFCIGK